jgi:hypothetical protein
VFRYTPLGGYSSDTEQEKHGSLRNAKWQEGKREVPNAASQQEREWPRKGAIRLRSYGVTRRKIILPSIILPKKIESYMAFVGGALVPAEGG